MKKKTTTYGDLKQRKAELRNEMEAGTFTELEEYRQVVQAIKDTELTLLWSITPNEAYGELVKSKAYKRVKYAVIGISIAVVLAIVLLSGCQTFKGATGDSAWILQKLSDNIQAKEK